MHITHTFEPSLIMFAQAMSALNGAAANVVTEPTTVALDDTRAKLQRMQAIVDRIQAERRADQLNADPRNLEDET